MNGDGKTVHTVFLVQHYMPDMAYVFVIKGMLVGGERWLGMDGSGVKAVHVKTNLYIGLWNVLLT